jgi:hypothetical protein
LDWRRLRNAGVVRPFHWAWIFLGPTVYVIGRTVVLRKVTRNRVLAPMIVFAVCYLGIARRVVPLKSMPESLPRPVTRTCVCRPGPG